MKKVLILGYGLICYLIFFVVFVYLAAFFGDLGVPKSINRGAPAEGVADLLLNSLFPLLFAIQHTIMARPRFKAWFTRIIPAAAERATFVLIASLILAAMMWRWKVMPTIVWQVDLAVVRWGIQAVFFLGWAIVLYSSFLIDHFDLFGLRQVWLNFRGVPYHHHPFVERSLYRIVRHPLMFGFLLAFWAAPTMTTGRLLLASILAGYIVLGTRVEERDLLHLLGQPYADYRRRTPMLLPLPRGKSP